MVLERGKKSGGFFKYDDYPVNGVTGRGLVDQFLNKVKVACSVTAFEYEGDGVWVDGREGSKKIHGRVVAANGFREKTALELGIFGSRPSGIFYLYSAWELVNRGYRVGDKVVIYGFNHYSIALASKLSKICEKVTVVYGDTSLVHSDGELMDLGIEVIKGRITEVAGKMRVSSIKVRGSEIEADTLILAELSTWNPLQVEDVVGNAAMIIEDPRKIVEASRVVAESLLEEGGLIEIISNVPHIPKKVSRRVGRVMLGVRGGVELSIDGRKTVAYEDYPIIEIPLKERVVIEVS